MSLFGSPKCPYCGGHLEETGWCAPYEAYRCPTCIKRNRQKKELQEQREEINSLKRRLAALEGEK